ncbi:MAG: symmetrical bis(5'-nucleosyl)-tetraphosphatase [Gammaproteobacteria bacterium]|nr:symmetrical bis(5'-nucleosyl)-tetraphosphatase [Gammaproteobacteria bacterium]
MAVYAIGDIQGCHKDLLALLSLLKFDATRDTLWFSGDLVNRGPDSLSVLRFVKALGQRAITVLGNHDIHLLAVAEGVQTARPKDTFDEILKAPDRDELLDWLRHRPLMHHDTKLNFVLAHAGISPEWDLVTAAGCAREVESILQRDDYKEFLKVIYGDQPDHWSPQLQGWDRYRYIVNAFTRMRFCETDGGLVLRHKGSPGSQPAPLIPWFQVANRPTANERILFGHWSTLGESNYANVFALDNGCVWGGMLTALWLDTQIPVYTHAPCKEKLEHE